MVYTIVEPSLGDSLHHANKAQVISALVLSIAVHAAVISWTPVLRPATLERPPTITVELTPRIEAEPPPPPAEVKPEPQPVAERTPEPIPEVKPEPRQEPRPEPKPEPKPGPEPKPRPKPVQKKPAPIKAPPPAPPADVASPPEPPQASPPAPIASPPATEAPPTSPVPAEPPPKTIPSELLKPQASLADDGVIDGYAQTLSGAIGKFQKYPRIAQMRDWEGTVEVLLKIAAGGKVRDISIAKSSGFDVLDEQALAMVKQATPLPKPPADLSARDFNVKVPIAFRLRK